jgi:uroporphyrinogen decarboxylase
MDPDWEPGMWNVHGLVRTEALGDIAPGVLREEGERRVVRTSLGEEYVERKDGASIAHTLVYPLEPTRPSWEGFKRFLNPQDPRRYPAGWREKAAALARRDAVNAFMGGSLYGWLRGFMGVENLSLLMYDDPDLLEEMVAYLADYFMVLTAPVLEATRFDFVYFFEDCCGASGPLFSPELYRALFDPHYRRMLRFYKDRGVPLALVDSDGWVEPLVPCWLASGFDILFPVEVGKWRAHPEALRRKFGPRLRMFGAVEKQLIYGPEAALRAHLESLRPSVEQGGLLPIPDHRIPPEGSYSHMLRYIRVFNEVFQ